MRRATGFTLLELMIAILIFAVISTAAYRLFNAVSQAQQVTEHLLDNLDALQRAHLILEKDLLQIVPRPIRNESGATEPALQAPGHKDFLVAFTRAGWRNPLGAVRSDLQRVAYELKHGTLVRYYWPVLDRAPDTTPMQQTVLTGVNSVQIQFMDAQQAWQSIWPATAKPTDPSQSGTPNNQENKREKNTNNQHDQQHTSLPLAVKMTLVHEQHGTLEIVQPLATNQDNTKARGKDDDDEEDDDDEDDEDEDE